MATVTVSASYISVIVRTPVDNRSALTCWPVALYVGLMAEGVTEFGPSSCAVSTSVCHI